MGNIIDFIKNSKFFGSNWVDYKNKKIYILPTEPSHSLEDFEMVFLNEELEYLNDIFILDGKKYLPRISKLYKTTLKRTNRLIDNKIKWAVYRKYGFSCFYCGYDEGELTYDHYIPSSKGGQTTVENGRPCCTICNHFKNDMSAEEWISSEELKDIIEKRKNNGMV